MTGIANGWVWFGFTLFVVFALSADTFLLSNKYARPHQSMRAALIWTSIWISSALIFNGLLWCYVYLNTNSSVFANIKALEFFSGYLIEKSLSVDNLFAFYLVFQTLHIPIKYQQRVFSFGIWGAIIMRLLFILLGVWLVTQFHWLLYVLGAFLLLTGVKIICTKEKEKSLNDSIIFKLVKRLFRISPELHDHHFFIKKNSLVYATPLFLALLFVEFSDVIFAMDSIPAIFAITTDPFIIWASNIFAILGLRALYFVLSGMVVRFRLLKFGIALILVFIGSKMMIEPWMTISTGVSLAVIISILIMFSLLSRAGGSNASN